MIYNTLIFTKGDTNEIEGLKLISDYSGEMVFSLDRYESEISLWDDILSLVKKLIKNNYVCEVYEEDTGIIIVRYSHDESKEAYGGPCLRWLSQAELDYLDDYRQITVDDLTSQLKPDEMTDEEKEEQDLMKKGYWFPQINSN